MAWPPVLIYAASALGTLLAILGALLLGRLLCRHHWEAIVDREVPSTIEVAKLSGVTLELNAWVSALNIANACRRKSVVVLRCRKCPKVIFKVMEC